MIQIEELSKSCSYLLADRNGGSSKTPYNSLNCSFGVGDTDEAVLKNRSFVRERLGVEVLLSAAQIHDDKVYILEERPTEDLEVTGYDALVTACTGVGLMVQHADCQPVLLYDSQKQVVGAVHSGWRGSVLNITANTVQTMVERFGLKPAELTAIIGPSLGPCCAEFVNYRKELPESFTDFMVGKSHFDFWAITRHQLQECGVLPENITVAGACTSCSEDYFSYRRACRNGDGTTGRNCSVIALNK